jgi:cupin fold WbuC family metalloprotein
MPNVYHSKTWGEPLEENILELLIKQSNQSTNRKARLCLHPNPEEQLQVTYLAFAKPYIDRVHKHPDRIEILIPVYGNAIHRVFDSNDKIVKSTSLNGVNPVALTTLMGAWHGIEVYSENFVMVEIGLGPFLHTSTVYK